MYLLDTNVVSELKKVKKADRGVRMWAQALPARRRAEFYYQQLDALRVLRQGVRRELLAESKKQRAWKQLCQIPAIGPIRAAVLLGILQTPHRFRTKRPLWKYSGLAIETKGPVGRVIF